MLILAFVLATAAMLLYPGGTYLNPTARGYSFWQNSISDLGATVSWSGQRNYASPFLLAACASLLLGAAGCFMVLLPIYSSSLLMRWLTRVASALVLVAGVSLAAATATPQDRYPVLHGRLSIIAIASFPAGTAILGITSLLNPQIRRRAAAVWFVLAAIILAWASRIFDRPTTPLELAVPVTLQKIVGFSLIAALLIQGYEAERSLTERNASARSNLTSNVRC
jgi:hypothetical protein